ncbi:auxin-responsive protein SAUR71-like [Curcuma longa]|uniref:auxin-responsive protein SAUR71-like n=1 Tax=Curcuma longa TaxID=136217 RepID=UPI003D9E8F1B
MKRQIRRASRVADASHCWPPTAANAPPRRVPWGHVPVHVGEEMERFAVRVELLGRPAFIELLRRSAQEYGYGQRGVLRIPCPVPLFRRVLLLLSSSSSAAASATDPALEELFRALPADDDGHEADRVVSLGWWIPSFIEESTIFTSSQMVVGPTMWSC